MCAHVDVYVISRMRGWFKLVGLARETVSQPISSCLLVPPRKWYHKHAMVDSLVSCRLEWLRIRSLHSDHGSDMSAIIIFAMINKNK